MAKAASEKIKAGMLVAGLGAMLLLSGCKASFGIASQADFVPPAAAAASASLGSPYNSDRGDPRTLGR